ncbi:hypothetical protein [Pelagerythrobacter aerophilus]
MRRPERGSPAPERREGRARLSVRDPLIESLVVGLGVEGEILNELRDCCKQLVRDRNHWSIRRAGLFSSRKLNKSDADRALSRALAELVEEHPHD